MVGKISAMSRRIWLGAAALVVVGFVLVAFILANFMYLPVLGDLDPGTHEVASLPDSIHVCGRSWSKDGLDRQYTLAQIADTFGTAPTVVDTRPLAPCPGGACTASAAAACETVIFVRVGSDSFVDYSLRGGP